MNNNNLENLSAIIDGWAKLLEEARTRRRVAEQLIDTALTDSSKQMHQRDAYAFEYIEQQIERLANMEGITGEGVRWFENKNRQTGSDNDKAVEVRETTAG